MQKNKASANMAHPKICTIAGCNKPHKGLGLCSAHYHRARRHGSPEIRLRAANGECLRWIEDHVDHLGDDCLIWPYARGGAGDAVVYHNGIQRSASRVMCEVAHGLPASKNLECAHSCGNGHLGCMNPRHLRWDTRAGNFSDKLIHGTHNGGERNPNSILNEKQVEYILNGSKSAKELSVELGVSKANIYAIREGKRWKRHPSQSARSF